MVAIWPTRRLLRLAFAATAAAALAGHWLERRDFSSDFLTMLLVAATMVLGTAATLVSLVTAWRGDAAPEAVVLVLLFVGGLAMLFDIVTTAEGFFATGLAIFSAGAACTGEGAPEAPAPSRRRRPAE